MGFAAWELSRHSDRQARLRDELLTINRQPTYEDLHERLPYLDAVMKETSVILDELMLTLKTIFSLRLYPALPYMERVATKEDILPLSQAVSLSDGQMVYQLPVKPGQVCHTV